MGLVVVSSSFKVPSIKTFIRVPSFYLCLLDLLVNFLTHNELAFNLVRLLGINNHNLSGVGAFIYAYY